MIKQTVTIFFLLLASVASFAQQANELSPWDEGKPVGWATVDGTVTGGEGGGEVVVTTFQEFDDAMLRVNGKKDLTVKRTIFIKGDITFPALTTYNGVENKTIVGLPGSSLQNMDQSKNNSGILKFTNKCTNIILRNITFKGPGAYDVDGNDNLLIQDGHYIWVDHCDFQDGLDGNFDINNGSDHIAVTWCRFRYLLDPKAGGSGGANDHRFSNLIGSSDGNTADRDHLNVTFANCWWDNGCMERCPRVRYGKVHLVNCLFTNEGYHYLFGTGKECNIYVEKSSICTGTVVYKNPGKAGTDWNITITDCIGSPDVKERYGSWDFFTPSDHYTYTAYDKELVKDVVSDASNGAGATLKLAPATAVRSLSAECESVRTYQLTGMETRAGGTSQVVIERGRKVLSK